MVQQVIWYGIVQGSIVAVGALGFTLLFGILNFFNVAFAEYITVGTYMVLTGSMIFNLPFMLSIGLAVAVAGLVALLVDFAVFRQFRDRTPLTLLIVSIGVTFVIRAAIRIFYGSDSRLIDFPIQANIDIFGIHMLDYQIVTVITTIAFTAGTFYIIHNTDIGIAMRAVSENADLVRVRGLDTENLIRYVTLFGGVLAGTAGVLTAFNYSIDPLTGFAILIPVFAAVMIGGVGDPLGAIIGGYSIGIVQELSTLFISPSYKSAIALLVIFVALLLKPDGIFGEATRV